MTTRTNEVANALGTTLRRRRKELGLTQQDLADLSGASPRFIHDLENGKPTVRLDRLVEVAETLGLALTLQLLGSRSTDRPAVGG